MADSGRAKRKEPEPADWHRAVGSVLRLLREINEQEKRDEEELREERELAAWVEATRAERYARYNLPLPTPEEEAEIAAAARRLTEDFYLLRPEDHEETKSRLGNDGILRHFD
ncbi:hypothetical protein E2562_025714 [Oryza meyeriana var. granulata]|uniref:Uncharacterized protein n=1 Tax=Oryza meyeriana var. granulata TaxID=110450 RepID=A0A6G1CTB4_9ORYZ|nr:hypothetical protein E2562_025714 [Oryza meyeriana var. granulata]